eukprot:gnl/TRDRNA2_/TRDRNA2_82309_c0_seq1.p1 gnl/TRDRNA2_/TRDRNA2_82309_c0~~gnl/TRDRNA2_/TRDRNA2_82309_c0_seq1.p1  ORF type:complete len:337 (+),score=60.00 gnl/TRDRNA2_/TRDRNA2_82309_c0_seq1:80-1090(+)
MKVQAEAVQKMLSVKIKNTFIEASSIDFADDVNASCSGDPWDLPLRPVWRQISEPASPVEKSLAFRRNLGALSIHDEKTRYVSTMSCDTISPCSEAGHYCDSVSSPDEDDDSQLKLESSVFAEATCVSSAALFETDIMVPVTMQRQLTEEHWPEWGTKEVKYDSHGFLDGQKHDLLKSVSCTGSCGTRWSHPIDHVDALDAPPQNFFSMPDGSKGVDAAHGPPWSTHDGQRSVILDIALEVLTRRLEDHQDHLQDKLAAQVTRVPYQTAPTSKGNTTEDDLVQHGHAHQCCSSCGKQKLPDAFFCYACGAALKDRPRGGDVGVRHHPRVVPPRHRA